MKSEILYPGAFPMVRVYLADGETVKAESGAMVAASPTIDIESKMEGGFLGALSRKMLSGEKFFFQTLRASRGAGEVLLAPTVPGEIVLLELDGVNEYMVQKDGFLAGAEGVKIESKMQSLTRGLLGGEGFFILRISGTGQLMLNSFGAIHKIESITAIWSPGRPRRRTILRRPPPAGLPASHPVKAWSAASAVRASCTFKAATPEVSGIGYGSLFRSPNSVRMAGAENACQLCSRLEKSSTYPEGTPPVFSRLQPGWLPF